MLRHYIVIAYRNVVRHWPVSVATIVGYALTLSMIIPVILIIDQQRHNDRHHPQNVYRITTISRQGYEFATTPVPLASFLRTNVAGIKSVHSILPREVKVIDDRYGAALALRAAFVDSAFFDAFNLDNGTTNNSALQNGNSIVITKKIAQRLFGTSVDPIGKVLSTERYGQVVVSAILGESAGKSHLDFDAYLLSAHFGNALYGAAGLSDDDWHTSKDAYTYIVPNGPVGHIPTDISRALAGTGLQEHLADIKFGIQSVKDIVGSGLIGDTRAASVQRPTIFLIFGLILFAIATMNYFNLFITRATTRTRETGIRRMFGVARWNILLQYFLESLLLLLIATFVGLGIMMALPLSQMQRIMNELTISAELILLYVAFVVVLAILTAIIPLGIVSRGTIIGSLKTRSGSKRISGIGLQKGMLVLQLVSAVTIGIVVSVSISQSNLMANADYGFKADNLWLLDLQGLDGKVVENAVRQVPGIERTALVSRIFGYMPEPAKVETDKDTTDRLMFRYAASDTFIGIYDLEIVAGNDLRENAQTDNGVLINEKAASELGYEQPAMALGTGLFINDSIPFVVRGVIKDFHYDNFKRPIKPMFVTLASGNSSYLVIELHQAANFVAIENQLASLWKRFDTGLPLSFENYGLLFKSQRAYTNDLIFLSTIAGYIATISLLSLIGVTMHNMQMRSHAMTMHKVVGATRSDVLGLLSREFRLTFTMTLALALPLGYCLSRALLQEFAVKTSLNASMFVLPVGIVVGLSILIVMAHAFHHATVSPVRFLRHE